MAAGNTIYLTYRHKLYFQDMWVIKQENDRKHLVYYVYCSVSVRIFSFWNREVLQRIHNEEIILFCVLTEPKYLSTLIFSSKAPKVISSCSFKSALPLWIWNKIYLSLKFHKGNKRKDGFFVVKQTSPGMRNLISTACWVFLIINIPRLINGIALEIHSVNCSHFTFWPILS